jgi:hypothetical protein
LNSSLLHSSQSRRPSRSPTGHALARAAKGAHASKRRAATLASIENLAALPELGQSRSQRRGPRRHPEERGELPEEPSMRRTAPLASEAPGVRRFVPQRVLLGSLGQMRGDRDAVGISVNDLSARELSPRQPHDRGAESKTSGEPIVEELEMRLPVRFWNREERAQHRD